MAVVNLGIVYEPHKAELAELGQALETLTGRSPEKKKVRPYAGPNEVVQLLVDAATWESLLMVFGACFGGPFLKKLGELAAADVWKDKALYHAALKMAAARPVLATIEALKAIRAKNQTVSIAVEISSTERNAALILTSNDEVELAWQIANVIRCAPRIVKILDEAYSANPSLDRRGENPDYSIPVEVLPNGDVRVLGVIIEQ